MHDLTGTIGCRDFAEIESTFRGLSMEVRYDTIQYNTINLRIVYCQSFVFEIEVQLGCLRHQCSINTLDLLELPKKSFCRHGRLTCDHNVKRQQYGSHRLLHCSWLCLLWINWNYNYLSNLSPSLSLSVTHSLPLSICNPSNRRNSLLFSDVFHYLSILN